MLNQNEPDPGQQQLPPDGYGQWNSEPPETHICWSDYFTSISQQAHDEYRRTSMLHPSKTN